MTSSASTESETPRNHVRESPVTVAILGAGAAGLTAARHLCELPGVQTDIFESADRIGGLLHSVDIDGLHFDVGTFLFFDGHSLLKSFPFLQESFVPFRYQPESVTPSGTFDVYPFTLGRFLKDHGVLSTAAGMGSLLAGKVRYRSYTTLPDFGRYYLGNVFYEQTGLRRYIHRLHDLPDTEIDLEFAANRLDAVSRQSIRAILSRQAQRLRAKLLRRPLPKPRQRLVRPAAGLPEVFQRIENHLEARGVRIQTDCRIRSVRRVNGRFHIQGDGIDGWYDRIVSTIPIPMMLRLIGQEPSTPVTTRSLVSLFYRGQIRNAAQIYFNFTQEARWKRITVFSKFYGQPKPDTDYFTVEITTSDPDSDSDLIRELHQEFEKHGLAVGLLKCPPELLGSYVTPDAYPVYLSGQLPEIEAEKQKLRDFGIDIVGRQGSFEYLISHFIAGQARTLAETMQQQLTPDRVGD
ncbi:MAG: FAD-dependent oxidoreductase [Planctomycetaceae bacterium]|nr:FAD-dependent oxidoreductase [Planctomycetaceae bacterium]